MSTKAIRIIDIAAGILLTAGGVFCLCNQDAAVVSAGILFGLFMLAAGIAEIVVFAGTSKTLLGSGWMLLERSADRYNGFAAPVQPMVHAAFIAPAVYTLAFVLGYRQICKCL